jgi:Rap1a immunity proteins
MTSTRSQLIALWVALSVTSVQAQQNGVNDKLFFNGNDVYSWYKTDRATALGYTAGLADEATHSAFVVDVTRPPLRPDQQDSRANLFITMVRNYCIPKTVDLDQVTDVFCNYLRDTPQERHNLPPLLFNDAMEKAWPCQR